MKRYKWLALFGAVLHAAFFALMIAGLEPFRTFFYLFAWWTFILTIGCMNRANGAPSKRPGEQTLLWTGFVSVTIWLGFEAVNFLLRNWRYTGVPAEWFLRWPGYVFSFATVLPGIFEVERFLQRILPESDRPVRRLRISRGLLARFLLIGTALLSLMVMRPEVFFPALWLAPIFLVAPILHWAGRPSLLRDFESGHYGPAFRLVAAGAICGGLWEFWNHWAGAKWIYTLPMFDFWRVFEMPLLGYLGFPFFALECWLLYQLATWFRELAGRTGRVFPVLGIATILAAWVWVVCRIDHNTVVTYRILLL